MLMMALVCIVPLIIVFGVAKYLGYRGDYLFIGAMLLCITVHFWMMKKGGHHG